MSKQESLRKALEKKNKQLFKYVEHLVEMATPQLWHTYGTFPSGTKHTPEHTQMVERIAGWLFPNAILRQLYDDEIAMLILACHYHDLGMAGIEADNQTPETRDQVRKEHAVSIGNRILEHWQHFGFANETDADVLADICRGHRPRRINGVATWDELPEIRVLGAGRMVRVRVVSAMIYAADELHIGEDRATRREEEFLKITDPESLPHWRRHQAITGPLFKDGNLIFEGMVATLAFENNLRKSLRKAFQSINEVKSQLKATGLPEKVSPLLFRWTRKKLWGLLIQRVCSDLLPRNISEIAAGVESIFKSEISEMEDLTDYCREWGNDEEALKEIERAISDFQARKLLVTEDEGGKLVLNGLPRASNDLFLMAKQADESDQVFQDESMVRFEYQLYQSPYGKRFVRELLHPKLRADYSLDVSSSKSWEYLKTTLESSPTAARIVQSITPPPTIMVQSDLLDFLTIAGICADLVTDPELILDRTYRDAVTRLFEAGQERLPKFLLFIEELAVIKKLTIDQVSEAMLAPQIPDRDEQQVMSVNITQTYPLTQQHWSLGHIMLASRRAEVSITIQNKSSAPFDVKPSESGIIPDEKPCAITIGPGKKTFPPTFSFRASFELKAEENQFVIHASNLTPNDSGKPLIVFCSPKGDQSKAAVEFQLIEPEVTIEEILTLTKIHEIRETLQTIVVINGKHQELSATPDIASIEDNETVNLFSKLTSISPSFPIPTFLEVEHLERLKQCDQSSLETEFNTIIENRKDKRPLISLIMIRFSSLTGEDYYEEFCGYLPPGLSFDFKIKPDKGISQDEFDAGMKLGKKDTYWSTLFREDMQTLAQTLKDWCADMSKPFPFKPGAEELHFHYARVKLVATWHRFVERLWHIEQKITFRFMPISNADRYELEMEYWKEQGDERRTNLLHDLFQKAKQTDNQTPPWFLSEL